MIMPAGRPFLAFLLPPHEIAQLYAHVAGRCDQVAIGKRLRVTRNYVKEIGHVTAIDLVGRQQSHVGVNPCGSFIKVTTRKMYADTRGRRPCERSIKACGSSGCSRHRSRNILHVAVSVLHASYSLRRNGPSLRTTPKRASRSPRLSIGSRDPRIFRNPADCDLDRQHLRIVRCLFEQLITGSIES